MDDDISSRSDIRNLQSKICPSARCTMHKAILTQKMAKPARYIISECRIYLKGIRRMPALLDPFDQKSICLVRWTCVSRMSMSFSIISTQDVYSGENEQAIVHYLRCADCTLTLTTLPTCGCTPTCTHVHTRKHHIAFRTIACDERLSCTVSCHKPQSVACPTRTI